MLVAALYKMISGPVDENSQGSVDERTGAHGYLLCLVKFHEWIYRLEDLTRIIARDGPHKPFQLLTGRLGSPFREQKTVQRDSTVTIA